MLSDFVTCFFTIHTVCYDYKSCRLFNIFDLGGVCEADNYRNTIGFVRMLQRCSIGNSQNKDAVVKDFERLGYPTESIENGLVDLIEEGLLESPDCRNVQFLQTLNVTPKGRFYIDRLIHMFDYLQYVQDRVPMDGKYHIAIETRFGDSQAKVVGEGDWEKRKQSVNSFIDFLAVEESNEELEYKPQPELLLRVKGGSSEPISSSIRDRVNQEIKEIEHRYYWKRDRDIEFVEIVPKFPKKEPLVDHGSKLRKYHDERS